MPHNYRVTNVDGCSDVRDSYHSRERAYSFSSTDSDYHSSTSDCYSESSRDVPMSSPDQPKRNRKMLMRTWLVRNVEEKKIPGLEWLDKNKTMIKIPWKHGSRHDWEVDEDCGLFKNWALHTNKYQEGKVKASPKKWKANFRCALNSLPDVEEVKDRGMTKGNTACKVYRLLQPKTRRRQGSVGRKTSAKKQIYSRRETKKAPTELEDKNYVRDMISEISSHPQKWYKSGSVNFPDSTHEADCAETDCALGLDSPSPPDSSLDCSFDDHAYAIRSSDFHKSNIPTMVEMESCAPEPAYIKPEVDRRQSCYSMIPNSNASLHSNIAEDNSDISDNFITTMLVDWENEGAGGHSIPHSTNYIISNLICPDETSEHFPDNENIIEEENKWFPHQLNFTAL